MSCNLRIRCRPPSIRTRHVGVRGAPDLARRTEASRSLELLGPARSGRVALARSVRVRALLPPIIRNGYRRSEVGPAPSDYRSSFLEQANAMSASFFPSAPGPDPCIGRPRTLPALFVRSGSYAPCGHRSLPSCTWRLRLGNHRALRFRPSRPSPPSPLAFSCTAGHGKAASSTTGASAALPHRSFDTLAVCMAGTATAATNWHGAHNKFLCRWLLRAGSGMT